MTTEEQPDSEQQPDPALDTGAAPRRRWLRPLLLTLGPVLVLGAGAYAWVVGGRYAETDNAYVKADKVSLSAQIAGPITEVLVDENEPVRRGQILFRIKDDPYQVAMDRARARLQGVRAFVQSLKSSYRQKQEELELARSDADFAEREYRRQSKLADDNLASESELDQARHDLDVARRRIAITQQALDELRAQLGGDTTTPVDTHPLYREARAAVDEAALNLDYTEVRAPFDGVAQETPEPGQYIRPGEAVMAVVADSGMWVEANFKETELTHVHPGQEVDIHVDTYPGRTWHGRVTSISQASGAEFSVLPPQNATGNWVKVVQRIPIRISIPGGPGAPPLRAGMSTTVKIDTGYQRPLPGFVRTALNWLGGPFAAAAADRK